MQNKWSKVKVMPSLKKHCGRTDYTFIHKPRCSLSLGEKLTSHFANLFFQEVLKGDEQVHANFWVTESSPLYCRRACQTLSENNLVPSETKFSWTPFLFQAVIASSLAFLQFCPSSASFHLEIILFHLTLYHKLSWPPGRQTSFV